MAVYELCTGGTLFHELKKNGGRIKESTAVLIFTQILESLSYLHSKQLCHRDIKLENYIFQNKKTFHLKLVDFGLTRMIKSGSRDTKDPVGTPYYVAPEILLGDCDFKSDMWSAGVVLFMLITGKPPYDGIDDKDTVMNIKNNKPTMMISEITNVTRECKDLLRKLLERNVSLRLSA